MKLISPQSAAQKQSQGAVLVDVRTKGECRAAWVEGSEQRELGSLDLQGFSGQEVLLLCKTGSRAKKAAARFADAAPEQVQVVDGGLDAWEAAGLPISRGQGSMSLERQVRIGAGLLVVLGVVLALLVNPWFWVLPAFVGSGLIFAGVTDWCGMGLLLARMPWNR